MIEAVTFDFWNTVMWEEPGSLRTERLAAWREELRADGPASPDSLERAHDAAHRAYEEAWRAGRQFRVPDAVDQVASELAAADDARFRAVLAQGFSDGGRRAAIHSCNGIADCLVALKAAGVRIGIVCDIGLTPSSVVRELLAREGLLGFFDATTFSDEVGYYKPSREIFEYALQELGVGTPSAAAHIGDRRRTDVGGAIAMGMTPIRYNGVYEDPATDVPDAPHVISHLAELPAILDSGR